MLTIKILWTVLVILCLIGLVWSFLEVREAQRLSVRNHEVAKFRYYLLDLSTEYIIRHLNDPNLTELNNPYLWLLEKHSYDEMLYSEKPLTLEEWFTEDEIKEIKS